MATSAAEEEFADTVAEIVAQLDRNPVLVEEVMGNGNTDAIREALSAKAARSSVPVHVVLTKAPRSLTTDNTAEELLTLLHARSGQDGVWFVATADTGHTAMAVYGDIDPSVANDETLLSLAVHAGENEVLAATHSICSDCYPSPAAEAGVLLDTLTAGLPLNAANNALDAGQVASYATSAWWIASTRTAQSDAAEMPTPGLYAVVATTTLLCVAVVAYRLLQAIGGRSHGRLAAAGSAASSAGSGRRGRRRPAPDARSEMQRWRGRAVSETRTLEEALGGTRGSGDWSRRDLASICVERAQSRVASSDLLEIIGAVVLARTGLHALSERQGQYRPCYVDPRHGSATTEAPVGGGTRVPVCDLCARALQTGADLEPLTVPTRFGGQQPYYEGSTVWAANGFGSLGGDWWTDIPR